MGEGSRELEVPKKYRRYERQLAPEFIPGREVLGVGRQKSGVGSRELEDGPRKLSGGVGSAEKVPEER